MSHVISPAAVHVLVVCLPSHRRRRTLPPSRAPPGVPPHWPAGSICAMKRNTHAIVPEADFRLLQGADSLSCYQVLGRCCRIALGAVLQVLQLLQA